ICCFIPVWIHHKSADYECNPHQSNDYDEHLLNDLVNLFHEQDCSNYEGYDHSPHNWVAAKQHIQPKPGTHCVTNRKTQADEEYADTSERAENRTQRVLNR